MAEPAGLDLTHPEGSIAALCFTPTPWEGWRRPMEMAIIICLPFVMAISIYSFKVAGMATFGLFALWFLTFWWEPARWINST